MVSYRGLDARFRFDLLGQQFESSFIGPYDLGIFQEASYPPYLLPGNDDRPLLVDDETTPIEVFNYVIVDAIIASGNFFVDASFDIDTELTCERIDISDVDLARTGSILAEFEALAAADRDADAVELLASLHCTLLSDIELILYPGVELQIAFQEFQLVPFELRIPLLDDRTNAVDFGPIPISFDMPPVDMPEGAPGRVPRGGKSPARATLPSRPPVVAPPMAAGLESRRHRESWRPMMDPRSPRTPIPRVRRRTRPTAAGAGPVSREVWGPRCFSF